MNCKELEIYLIDFFEGDLAKKQVDEMLDHIETCAACRKEFQAYKDQEERLGRYYQRELERTAEMTNPLDDAPPVAAPVRSRATRWLFWSAAALLALTFGYVAPPIVKELTMTRSTNLATVQAIEGHALVLSEGDFRPLEMGEIIGSGERMKVGGDGYLALTLSDGNVVEARGGTQFALIDEAERTVAAMRRGQILAHLNTPPAKPFAIRTAHLTATATGTVYGVEEGLDRSTVEVTEGTVQVESGGSLTSVAPSETFSSGDDEAAALSGTSSLAWSQYLEGNSADEQKVASATTTPQLIVEQASVALAAGGESSGPCVDYLPEETLYLITAEDLSGLIDEFNATDYSILLNEPAIREWWERIKAQNIFEEIQNETHLSEIWELAQLLDGQVSLSVDSKGEILILADSEGSAAVIWARLDAILAKMDEPTQEPEEFRDDLGETLRDRLFVAGGKIIFSSQAELAAETARRIRENEPTEFTSGEFYQKIAQNVSNPRLLITADLNDQIARWFADLDAEELQSEAELIHTLDFLGVRSLDYLLLSPDFVGQGMNQAARLAFKPEGRQGALDWLAEPAPMRGLDFFSPDIPIFFSAIVREPQQMLLDYLALIQNTEGGEAFQKALTFAAQNQPFFESFGGEIAIGLDRPILPVPNLKIAIEVIDRAAFQTGLDQLIQEFQATLAETESNCRVETTEFSERTIYTLKIDKLEHSFFSFEPSWAFVDDFFIAGPGPSFVRNSIEVYDSGHSIANDASRLLPLLPSDSEMNFSLLVYQDIAQSFSAVLTNALSPILRASASVFMPNLDFVEKFRAPGIAYAYARPDCVDLYLEAPSGIDLNFGAAAPFIANWILPQLAIGQTIDKVAEAQVALEEMRGAVYAFQQENGRLPANLGEIARPIGKYISRIPADPFAIISGDTLRMAPGANEVTLYSVGPDQVDDKSLSEYEITDHQNNNGDIILRVPGVLSQ